MPAAAVIPAPVAYTNVVAVKKLVVEILQWCGNLLLWDVYTPVHLAANFTDICLLVQGNGSFTLKKLECSRQAYV